MEYYDIVEEHSTSLLMTALNELVDKRNKDGWTVQETIVIHEPYDFIIIIRFFKNE